MKYKLLISTFCLLLCASAYGQTTVNINEHRRTPTITTASSSGTVAVGARKVTFIFSSDFSGTVLGATFSGSTDSALTIDAPNGDTLSAIAYTRSTGSVRIVVVR